jgi:DNA ligase-3
MCYNIQVEPFKEYIPKAFQHGEELILDCEVLMYDHKSNKPLPFGTLGIHKVFLSFLVIFIIV